MDLPTLGRDALAGVISAIVQIAYCISFSALIFQGALASGFSLGLAALIMGTVVTGIVVALTSTLSPADAGPDTPAVAVMSVLAGSIAAALAAKGASTQAIILNVMVGISVSTLFTGFLLFGLGALKLGQWVRFIPYPVIAGFLAASGWLLMTGGIEVVTQSNLTLAPASWAMLYSPVYGPQILVGLAFAVAIVLMGRLVPDYLALPVAFIGFLVIVNVVLFGFIQDETRAQRVVSAEPRPAHVVVADLGGDAARRRLGRACRSSAEIGAVCGITAISMLLDVSSLEVARQKSADLDKEFRTNGFANIIAAVLGGAGGNLVAQRRDSAREVGSGGAARRASSRRSSAPWSCSPVPTSAAWCRRRS